ncbi:MAG TPA: DUF393 domain-containing protein [Halococcus sp.]|nr:DUF393 domain-containing protein [Halococcus sp.]
MSFLSALVIAHLGAVRFTHRISGETDALFFSVYFLLFFGLYRMADELSVDGFRRTRNRSIDQLNEFLQSSPTDTYRMTALTGGLLAIATVYFGSGLDKARAGPLSEWIKGENLTRYIIVAQERFGIRTQIADVLHELAVQFPLLMDGLATGTIVLEMGFLLAILAGISITPFVLALLGMHTVIALAMGPFFTDQYVFLLLFFDWEWLHERLTVDRSITVVYDEQCYFCARCLYLFKLIDTTETVQFYTQSTVPERYRDRDDEPFEDAMYVFDNEMAYEGYDAFQRLIRQFRAFLPIAWVMGLSPVAWVGERVYRHIAANRYRYFVCAVDSGSSDSSK